MRRHLVWSVGAILIAACGGTSPSSAVAPVPTAAYRALLRGVVNDYELKTGDGLVLLREAHVPSFEAGYTSERFWAYLKAEVPDLRRETYDDFWARNGRDSIPEVDSVGPCSVVRMTTREFEQLIGSGSEAEQSRRFGARYPNDVLVQLSTIGLSGDGKQGLAFVYVARWNASICILDRSDGEWRVIDSLGMFVGD